MKIVITGSLGHISKPLTIELVKKGHAVTVISSKQDKQKDIEALGATAAIGSLEDVDFITATFKGADAVYCMVPPNYHIVKDIDPIDYYRGIGENYVKAIQQSGVKRVVHLSSIGAHLDKNTGLILAHHLVENSFKKINGVAITHMRPTAFYYNLNAFIPVIKNVGMIMTNYGGEDKVAWVSPIDIAAAVAEELVTPITTDHKIRYVASEELTCNELAIILGNAIGKPGLKWKLITDEQMRTGLKAAGLSTKLADGLVELNASIHSGELFEDYYKNRPAVLGQTKMKEFAKEFAITYNQ